MASNLGSSQNLMRSLTTRAIDGCGTVGLPTIPGAGTVRPYHQRSFGRRTRPR